MKKAILAVLAMAVCGTCVPAGATPAAGLAGSSIYSDPVFQDYVETADGYLNPSRRPAALRDAVISKGAAGAYVFVSILPKAKDYRGLVSELSEKTGFRFKGESVSVEGSARRLRILGWVRADALEQLSENPGVIVYSTF